MNSGIAFRFWKIKTKAMKALISLKSACLLMVFFVTSSAMAQFVTLDGRQFKDGNGNDWYPMVMDYFLTILYQPPPLACCKFTSPPTTFWPAPAHHYGSFFGLEHNTAEDCAMDLNRDFALIKNTGFNAIRITSGVHWNNLAARFELETHWGTDGCSCLYYIPIKQPFQEPEPGETISNTDKYFDCLDQVISIAEENDLMVMLDIILFNKDRSFHNEMETDLLSYLNYFGRHFKDNANVFCYCTFEEIGFNDPGLTHSKQYVCDFTTACYNALKTADSNHLISISGHETSDICEWDVSAMKMDFYQPHIYPEIGDRPVGYQDVDEGIDRFKSKLYWLSKNCPVPWLIGETGFRSNDEFYDGSHLYPFAYPMDGNEAEQLFFAQQSVEATYAYGGSGYSWFMYQDGWNYDSLNTTACPDGHGILRQGLVPYPPFPEPSPSTPLFDFEKPVGNYFRYLQHPQSVNPQSLNTKPDTYYDPYGTASLNNTDYNRVSGIIIDENSQPVSDAVIFAWNLKDKHTNPINFEEILDAINQIYTLSDSAGKFNIEPFNWEYTDDTSFFRIVKIWGSATSFNSELFSSGGWTTAQVQESNFTINHNKIEQNIFLTGQSFPTYTYLQFPAWNKISVANSLFQGNSGNTGLIELIAREIELLPETNCSFGSQVDIKSDAVLPPCSEFTNSIQQKTNTILQPQENKIGQITLKFTPAQDSLQLFISPNPTTGNITIISNYTDELSFIYLTDLLGNVVLRNKITDNTSQITLEHLPNGIYLIYYQNRENTICKKIIKL